jgi:hypothetical protein
MDLWGLVKNVLGELDSFFEVLERPHSVELLQESVDKVVDKASPMGVVVDG